MKNLMKEQKEVTDVNELARLIKGACCISELDTLRLACVKFHDSRILKLWQDKYWGMKQCPTCGGPLVSSNWGG
jgi:hypothetical protein